MADTTFTTYQIAKFCDVYPSSVIHWINAGKLKAYLTPGGHHRVTREDLLAFFKAFGMPVPEELESTRRKVLIVDDDREMAGGLERAFNRFSSVFKVETCHTGVDALISIGRNIPDLVVLDIVLPKMDGSQVCRILKSKPETRAIKIVGISGKKLPNDKKLDEYEIDAFFRKPLDVLQLVSKASALLGLELPAPSKPRST